MQYTVTIDDYFGSICNDIIHISKVDSIDIKEGAFDTVDSNGKSALIQVAFALHEKLTDESLKSEQELSQRLRKQNDIMANALDLIARGEGGQRTAIRALYDASRVIEGNK